MLFRSIFVVALLLFGPRKMPQIGRSIGRAMGEFRRASNEFKRTIEDEVAADEIREVEKDLKEIKKTITDPVGISDLKTSFKESLEQPVEPAAGSRLPLVWVGGLITAVLVVVSIFLWRRHRRQNMASSF